VITVSERHGQTDDILWHNRALRSIASRGKSVFFAIDKQNTFTLFATSQTEIRRIK